MIHKVLAKTHPSKQHRTIGQKLIFLTNKTLDLTLKHPQLRRRPILTLSITAATLGLLVVWLSFIFPRSSFLLAPFLANIVPTPNLIIVEPETGNLSSPMVSGTDLAASNNKYVYTTVTNTGSGSTPGPLPGQQIWNNGISSFLFGSNMTQEWSDDNTQTDPQHIIQSSMKNAHMQLERVFIFHYSLADNHRSSIGLSPQSNALQLLGSNNSAQTEFGTPATPAGTNTIQNPDPSGSGNYEIEKRIKTAENMGTIPLCTLKDITTDPTNNTDPNTAHKRVTDPDTGQPETDLAFAKKVVAYLGNRCNLYEIGNEPDLDNPVIGINLYVNRWVEFVKALKQINPNAKFIGPVTYNDQGNYCWYGSQNGAKPFPQTQPGDCYMRNFMHGVVNANDPTVLPDAISFHWYGDVYCNDGATPGAGCLPNMPAYYTNVINEVRGWVQSDLGHSVPLGITEWNANPNIPQYMVSDPTFANQWTTAVMNAMIAAKLDFSNQFDTQDYGGYCALDMFNSCAGTDQPTGTFTAMSNLISQNMPTNSQTIPANTGSATNTINITSAGTYYLWTRMQATDSNSDSFWLQIDSSPAVLVGNGSVPFGSWTWVNWHDGNTSNVISANLTTGSHTIKIIGREANTKIDNIVLTQDSTFNPANPEIVDSIPPVATVNSPSNNSTLSGTASISVNATDDHSVSKVDLLLDNTTVATQSIPSSGSTYTFSLDTTKYSSGSHSLMAKATDIAGNVGSSSILTVNISQPSPTPPPPPPPSPTPTPSPSPSPTPTPTPPPPTIVGDLNGDGKVNILDFSILLRNWGAMGGPADLNHDGIVNIFDLSILLSNWKP